MTTSNADAAMLEHINRYARKTLTEKDVYVFSMTLCDNEIDRDFERFSTEALEGLAKLFKGKTGIFDHNAKSSAQTARIFETWIETDPARLTSTGEPYTMLRARAYMVRTKENAALIEEIEGGIKKEVSVGCSMGSAVCSICGKDRRGEGCEHMNGKQYGKRLCHTVLQNPTDAYEWSFVAVPAQREAGVTKAFLKEEIFTTNILERMHTAKGAMQLSEAEVAKLKAHLTWLENEQAEAKAYREHLLSGIEKYLLLALPKVNCKLFLEGCSAMPVRELQTLKDSLGAQAALDLPPSLQLSHAEPGAGKQNNQAFCI